MLPPKPTAAAHDHQTLRSRHARPSALLSILCATALQRSISHVPSIRPPKKGPAQGSPRPSPHGDCPPSALTASTTTLPLPGPFRAPQFARPDCNFACRLQRVALSPQSPPSSKHHRTQTSTSHANDCAAGSHLSPSYSFAGRRDPLPTCLSGQHRHQTGPLGLLRPTPPVRSDLLPLCSSSHAHDIIQLARVSSTF